MSSLDSIFEQAVASSSATSSQDAVLVALHASLLSAGFVCVSIGDEGFAEGAPKPQDPVSTPSQPKLPLGWNSSQDACTLQYQHKQTQQFCLVKAIPMGAHLLINAVAACQMEKVFSMTLQPSKYVSESSSYTSQSIYKCPLELISALNRDIVAKLSQMLEQQSSMSGGGLPSGASSTLAGNTPSTAKEDPGSNDPLRVGPPGRPTDPDPLRIGPPGRHIDPDPLRIGPPRRPTGDLDPLGELGPFGYGDRDRLPGGGIGGGMIYDPLRQGSRGGTGGVFPGPGGVGPRGPYPPGHPPGARFDPVSPLRPNFRPHPPPGQLPHFYGPDPDHLPPPGYDDMFS